MIVNKYNLAIESRRFPSITCVWKIFFVLIQFHLQQEINFLFKKRVRVLNRAHKPLKRKNCSCDKSNNILSKGINILIL